MSTDELRKRLSQFLIKRDYDDIEKYIQDEVQRRVEASPQSITYEEQHSTDTKSEFSTYLRSIETGTISDFPSEDIRFTLPPTALPEESKPIEYSFDTKFAYSAGSTEEGHSEYETGFRTRSFYEHDDSEEHSFFVDETGLTDPNKLGPYQKHVQLGKGAMGSVWRVQDPSLYRKTALKVIHTESAMTGLERDRFTEEAQITAQLQHPGIVPVYDYGTLPSGHLYFTMKEVQGRTLKEVMRSVHQVSQKGVWRTTLDGWNFRKLITAFLSVCRTIAYAHSRGVIHCDIKPSNIMIGDYGEVLVVDWGISKVIHNSNNQNLVHTDRTQSGTTEPEMFISGTPVYMSPEQASGMNSIVGERSDIYCLGSTLYHIMRGIPPFIGDEWSILSDKCTRDPVSVRTPIREELKPLPLPEELVVACTKAMARIPSNRYDCVSDFADAVEQWLDGVQRRDKAFQILSKVQDLEKQYVQRQREQKGDFLRAQKELEEDISSQKGWERWHAIQDSIEKSNQIMLEIEQQLHGALIYDSQVSYIHEKLAHIEYSAYREAHQREDYHAKNRYLRRFQTYLDVLPKEQKEYWERKLQNNESSLAFVQRKRGTFIGRESIKKKSLSILKEQNFVCLVGTAGVGKTHLALEVGMMWKEENSQDSFFCDMSSVRNKHSLFQMLGKTLSIPLNSPTPKKDIFQSLAFKNPLLIIDNVEQIAAHITDFIETLHEELPQIGVIVTSRIPIGSKQCHLNVEPMRLLEGVELFVQRAQKLRPDFSITEKNRITVGQLVQQLDCLPLAIELAASKVSTLSIGEIESKLNDRFALLRSKVRSDEKRTLFAAVEWSWDLLSSSEKEVLLQCSAFEGGFTLKAAESVVVVTEEVFFVDIMEALVDDCLLRKEEQEDGSVRYNMLTFIHEFSAKKRDAQGNTDAIFLKHAQYYASILEQESTRDDQIFYGHFQRELHNLIIASERGTSAHAFSCCLASLKLLSFRGPISLAVQVTKRFLDRESLESKYVFQVQLEQLMFLSAFGQVNNAEQLIDALEKNIKAWDTPDQYQKSLFIARLYTEKSKLESFKGMFSVSQEHAFTAKNLFEKINNTKGICSSLQLIARTYTLLYKYEESLEIITQAKVMAKKHRYPTLLKKIQNELPILYIRTQKYDQAIEEYNIMLTHVDRTNKSLLGQIYGNMAICYKYLGKYTQAIEANQKSLKYGSEVGNKRGMAICHGSLGVLYQSLGRIDESIMELQRAKNICVDIKNRLGECVYLGNIGSIYTLMQKYKIAETFLLDARTIAQEIGNGRNISLYTIWYGYVLLNLGKKEGEKLMLEGIEQAEDISKGIWAFGCSLLAFYRSFNNEWVDIEELIERGMEHLVEHNERGAYLCRRALIYGSTQSHSKTHEAFHDCMQFMKDQNVYPNTNTASLWSKVQEKYAELQRLGRLI